MAVKSDICAGEPGREALDGFFFDDSSVHRGTVRKSKMGRRRAWVLIGIHVIVFLHILHWKLAGTTLSPVEPSEAMYTVASGAVNAGAILLVISLLSVLLLGRWFCGWACHLVALQDGCAWLLKKVGLRPQPLRSRWLAVVPLLAALLMFGAPAVVRAQRKLPTPELREALMREGFWDTFPGWGVGALTFIVCGGVMVWLLGAKGFCTYACPYGGLFGVVDRFSPARIRVTDACKGCGHCTAVCTSNVVVHDEVRQFGMVVDTGCMKCLDCVSVCPEDALYFGFGRPAIFAPSKRPARKGIKLRLPTRTEVLLTVSFAAALFVFRGLPDILVPWTAKLYDQIPELFGLALAAVTAYAVLLGTRLVRAPEVVFTRLRLKTAGRLTSRGLVGGALVITWLAFVLHCAVVQVHLFAGKAIVGELARDDRLVNVAWTQDPDVLQSIPAATRQALARAEEHYQTADSMGLVADWRLSHELTWLALTRGDLATAEREARAGTARAPGQSARWMDLVRVLRLKGDPRGAIEPLRRAIATGATDANTVMTLGMALKAAGDRLGAIVEFRKVVAREPRYLPARLELGLALLVDPATAADAVEPLEAADRIQPGQEPIAEALAAARRAAALRAAASRPTTKPAG